MGNYGSKLIGSPCMPLYACNKKPQVNQSLGVYSLYVFNVLGGYYMLSIMTWPKPEQLTWVAPSIKRAKS
jgi:hypothetical protein